MGGWSGNSGGAPCPAAILTDCGDFSRSRIVPVLPVIFLESRCLRHTAPLLLRIVLLCRLGLRRLMSTPPCWFRAKTVRVVADATNTRYLCAALSTRLESRPTQRELVDRNIIRGSSHPKLHAASAALSWDMREATLNRKLQNRPTKDEVVQRNIMKAQPSALVAERRNELEAIQKRRLLESRLENRPGPLDLVCSGYIEPPGNLDVSSCVKREWTPADDGQMDVGEGPNPPLPPPLPELSPARGSAGSFDFGAGGPSDPLLSPAPRRPSLYSISSPDPLGNWAGANGAEKGSDEFSFDFMLGMDMGWPADDMLVEHGHIVQEQLKHQVQQVNPFAAATGSSSELGPVVEDVHDTFRKKAGMHVQLTEVQRRATLPMRSIRPRVQASNAEEYAAPQAQPIPAAAAPPEGGSDLHLEWASQLAQMDNTRQRSGSIASIGSNAGGSRSTSTSQSTTARKKNKKIKKFTYHNYTGPVEKKKTKRKMGTRVTPPSPNRQIVLRQQEQFLKLEKIAEHRLMMEGRGTSDTVDPFAAASGNPASRTPPDLDAYGTNPTSLQNTFDRLNPAVPSISVDFDMSNGDAAADGVVRRIPSPPGSRLGHQRAGSWGGRLESPLDVSVHRSSTPLMDLHVGDGACPALFSVWPGA